jgi:hypothetical protein
MSTPLTPVTYWRQLFDQKANLALLAVVVLFFLLGCFFPANEGRSMLWPGSLIVLAVFFLMPWLHGEQRDARKRYQEALAAEKLRSVVDSDIKLNQ